MFQLSGSLYFKKTFNSRHIPKSVDRAAGECHPVRRTRCTWAGTPF